jgi:hypothetical protein
VDCYIYETDWTEGLVALLFHWLLLDLIQNIKAINDPLKNVQNHADNEAA